jgi:ABC-type uncharacterized transport system substrate-binding protein
LLTIYSAFFLSRLPVRLASCVGLMLLMLGSAQLHAASVTVVLSDDSAPYHETADAIEAALGQGHAVIRVLSDKLAISDSALSRSKLLVTVGIKAAEQIADRGGKTPVLAVLVTEDWYQKQGSARLGAGGRSNGAVVLEQPLPRQLRLVRSAFPGTTKVGVVLGRSNAGQLEELEEAASAQGLTLVGATTESEATLVATLGQVLMEADLLLAVPDTLVLNRNTVQSVLMTTYRYRDPMVGYSKALSRAGALVSLYSTPAQIGRQAGEIASRTLNGTTLSGLQWPKYFSVSVNEHVARSLGIDAPSEDVLQKKLGGEND